MSDKKIYYAKLKQYSDGTATLYFYPEGRVKPNNLSFNSLDRVVVKDDEKDVLKDSREKHLFEVRRKLKDYARNNDFDKFWTLTFDPNKCSKSDELRFDLMAKWLKCERQKAKRLGKEFRYIFIPEYHPGEGVNGNTVHWHGVTGGYAPQLVDSGVKHKGVKVYNCASWTYGYTTISNVRSKVKVANYIQKYLTKDFINSPVRFGKKKYWSSRNLKLPEQKYIDVPVNISSFDVDWENDFVKIYELNADDFII